MGYDEFEMKSNEKFIVQGNPLQGEITPGNKNEALPVLAVLLTVEPYSVQCT